MTQIPFMVHVLTLTAENVIRGYFTDEERVPEEFDETKKLYRFGFGKFQNWF